jgi:error-prone DNA polymerase
VERVAVELWDHGHPSTRPATTPSPAWRWPAGVDVVATNDVHYATPARRPLATALAAVRSRRSLDEVEGWLPAGAGACLRPGWEQERRFARYPGVVARAAELALECAFDLALVAPRLPDFPVPPGHDEMSWLRELTEQGARRRYGPRGAERVPGAYAQIDHELAMIDQLGFPGYFLIVWDLVEFCRRQDIYCQGRGSAANSAACYALGITKADAVTLGLLFERFLSPERDGPPDIDLDIEAGRREEVIQYAYRRYGRERAAQVANVITYRARSAVRDMGRALGHAVGHARRLVQAARPLLVAPAGGGGRPDRHPRAGARPRRRGRALPPPPRHPLGRHGDLRPAGGGGVPGRVGAHGRPHRAPVGQGRLRGGRAREVRPARPRDAHRPPRLHRPHRRQRRQPHRPGRDPPGPAVYEMLQAADSIGVFQVESRAQMATLPRLKPRTFYDLVVEVALIRPGPIQGGSVHPYIRRRNGLEPVTYLHPLLEKSLAKTLGVPLFQEQLMQMAIDVAGFSPGEADQLRQAMGSKRSTERMERLRGGSTRAWPPTGSPVRSPTGSSRSWRRSPTSASPRATR